MGAVSFYMERNRVSYHNLYHAVDVMHACTLLLSSLGVGGLLTELEQLGLVLAGLCHDLDHPGLNNKYQVASNSNLALRYNDQAPLEHHHLAIAFQILRREPCDILGHLDQEQKTALRAIMIVGILATDMSEHGQHITNVSVAVADFTPAGNREPDSGGGGGGGGVENGGRASNGSGIGHIVSTMRRASAGPCSAATGLNMGSGGGGGRHRSGSMPGAEAEAMGLSDKDRVTIFSALLHGADLSTSGRPWKTCKVWVLKLMEEFEFQADKEREAELPVSVMIGDQKGFINSVLSPFFTGLLPIAPGMCDEWMPNMLSNR
ncbi:unnamed protein product, partial [Discosporangium mesarthrocarpum]